VASLIDAPAASVRLHAPPPLDVELTAEVAEDGGVAVKHGDVLVATGSPAPPLEGLSPPVAPSVAEAREAMRHHFGWGDEHLLSHCFVCGPLRMKDGLGLTFGPLVAHPEVNAAVFIVDGSLPHVNGRAADELVWSALDCPSYAPAIVDSGKLAMLANLHAELLAPLPLGQPVVAVGWSLESEGRKHHTASALLGPGGSILARARALWISMRD
jgi:hypothetical protein